jgi:hypothetical protein
MNTETQTGPVGVPSTSPLVVLSAKHNLFLFDTILRWTITDFHVRSIHEVSCLQSRADRSKQSVSIRSIHIQRTVAAVCCNFVSIELANACSVDGLFDLLLKSKKT